MTDFIMEVKKGRPLNWWERLQAAYIAARFVLDCLKGGYHVALNAIHEDGIQAKLYTRGPRRVATEGSFWAAKP